MALQSDWGGEHEEGGEEHSYPLGSELEAGPAVAPIFPSAIWQRQELGEVLPPFLPQHSSTIYGVRPEVEKSRSERLLTLRNVDGSLCSPGAVLPRKELAGISCIQQGEGNRDPGRTWLGVWVYLVL